MKAIDSAASAHFIHQKSVQLVDDFFMKGRCFYEVGKIFIKGRIIFAPGGDFIPVKKSSGRFIIYGKQPLNSRAYGIRECSPVGVQWAV